MMPKRICFIIIIIIKKGENVSNVGFDDAEKNSLDNDGHHKKRGRL